jgi:RNA polymerase sigma factor (sigma-70 family)
MNVGRHRAGAEGPAEWPADFVALYEEHYPGLVRLAALLIGSGALAEEVVQEAFLRSRRALERADRPAAYLRSAVVNGCRSVHRRQALALRRLPALGGLSEAAEPELHELADVLALLPERQRTVLVLRYYADLSETEIAQLVGCRPGTVKSLAHRGLARLRALIEP